MQLPFRFFPLVLFVSLAGLLRAGEPAALSDLDAAKALAAKEHKQLVVEFSGRTWCPPCKALLAEVLPSAEFAAFVKDRVYVHLDYPARKDRTPEKVAADPALANLIERAKAHKIEGFPTVVLLATDGTELGRVVGYENGLGAVKYLAELSGAK